MPYSRDQVRTLLDRYGLSFRPGDSENSNTAAWTTEYEFWRTAMELMGTTPAQNPGLARKLTDAVIGVLNVTALDNRAATLKRFNEECGVDFAQLGGPNFYQKVSI